MSAQGYKKCAPDDVPTPPPDWFYFFVSDGSTATLSPGTPATGDKRLYRMESDRSIFSAQDTVWTEDAYVAGAGPFALSENFSGEIAIVFFDGVEQPGANYGVTTGSTVFTIAGAVDTSLFDTIRIKYTYTP